MLFAVELRRPIASRSALLGWPLASSAFAVSVGGVFLLHGGRHLGGALRVGHRPHGAPRLIPGPPSRRCPTIARRPHADLTDILGSVQPHRDRRRHRPPAGRPRAGVRHGPRSRCAGRRPPSASRAAASSAHARLNLASAVYLALAVSRTLRSRRPDTTTTCRRWARGRLPVSSRWQGSRSPGSGLLLRASLDRPPTLLGVLWLLPAVAVGFGVAWALHAEWAVLAYAVLTAAVRLPPQRRTCCAGCPTSRSSPPAPATGLPARSSRSSSPRRSRTLADSAGNGFGAIRGPAGVVALLVSAGVLAWSLRRPLGGSPITCAAAGRQPRLPDRGGGAPPYTIWAWLGVGRGSRLAMHFLRFAAASARGRSSAAAGCSARARRRLGLRRIAGRHRRSRPHAGWESIAIATVSALIVATASPKPPLRDYALWLPSRSHAACRDAPARPVSAGRLGRDLGGLSLLVAVWPRPLAARLARGRCSSCDGPSPPASRSSCSPPTRRLRCSSRPTTPPPPVSPQRPRPPSRSSSLPTPPRGRPPASNGCSPATRSGRAWSTPAPPWRSGRWPPGSWAVSSCGYRAPTSRR